MSSFIENVNNLSQKMLMIEEATTLFNTTIMETLNDLNGLEVATITQDLMKSNYLGNRKIDINLALNNKSSTTEVSYQGMTLTMNTGVSLQVDFTVLDANNNPVIEELTSYASIYNRLIDAIASYNAGEADPQLHILNTEIDIINDTLPELPTMIRLRDVDCCF